MRNRRVGPERVVAGIRIWCRPRGAGLRDLTDPDGVRWVHWFTAAPGLLSLLGLVLHHTVYRRQWEVVAVPVGGGQSRRFNAADWKGAELLLRDLATGLAEGSALRDFTPGEGSALGD